MKKRITAVLLLFITCVLLAEEVCVEKELLLDAYKYRAFIGVEDFDAVFARDFRVYQTRADDVVTNVYRYVIVDKEAGRAVHTFAFTNTYRVTTVTNEVVKDDTVALVFIVIGGGLLLFAGGVGVGVRFSR